MKEKKTKDKYIMKKNILNKLILLINSNFILSYSNYKNENNFDFPSSLFNTKLSQNVPRRY